MIQAYGDKYMNNNKTTEVIEVLNKIMEYELSGVVRYTHTHL